MDSSLSCQCSGTKVLLVRLFLLGQLAAGGRDIRAPAVADEDRVVGIHEDLLESEDPGHGGALIGDARGFVVGQEVDLAGDIPELSGQFMGRGFRIIDPLEQDILKHDPFAFRHGKVAAGGQQLIERIALIDRHEPAAGGVINGMERDGQIGVGVFSQLPHPGNNAAGGDRYPAVGEVQSPLFGEDGEGLEQIFQIVQRLTHAHEDDIGDLGRADALFFRLGPQKIIHGADLAHDLARGEITDKAHGGREAEGTVHGTSYLGGDAEGVAVRFRDEDRFDHPPVIEGKAELDAAIIGALENGIIKAGDAGVFGQQLPEILGQISHLGKLGDAGAVEPGHELTTTKCGLAKAHHVFCYFILRQIAQVGFVCHFTFGRPSKIMVKFRCRNRHKVP